MADALRQPLRRLALAAALCGLVGAPGHAQTLADAMLGSRGSVARILASDCGAEPDRVGTGFLWRDARTVVTARHVVAGCRRISTIFTETGRSSVAHPTRELRRQDLALLLLDGDQPAVPLEASGDLPAIDSQLASLGYAYGMPTLDSKKLDVTLGNRPPGALLRDILTDDLTRTLARSGEIDVDTGIVRLDGNLLPGLSGAPLIGGDGKVYGIGSGGLQQGAGGVVWAVRSQYLAALAASAPIERIESATGRTDLSFSYQQPQAEAASVACGDARFVRSGRLPLAKLAETTDDRMGLQQLAAVLGIGPDEVSALQFDLWNDPASGTAVAIPSQATLEASDTLTGCTARVSDEVALVVRVAAVDGSPAGAQTAALRFEADLGDAMSRPLAMPDPQFTYVLPNQRPDGFVVRRVAYNLAGPSAVPGHVGADYVFISHLFRSRTYVGVAALRRNTAIDMQLMQVCQFNPYQGACLAARQSFRPWNAAALATHLATMPPI